MQIIFIAVIFGLAMLVLDDKATTAGQFIEQLNYMVQLIMETISATIPIFIFVSILQMFLSDVISTISSLLKPLGIVCLGSLAVLLMFFVLLSALKEVPFSMLVKKLLPVFMIGITTASSSAAFATNIETCEKKLGVHPKIVSFGLPLGSVLFMPASAVGFLIIAMCMAEIFGVAITLPWLLIAILLSGILAMAAPPIPGGAISSYTILFSQLGIPPEALPFAIAIEVVFDFVATAVNITSLPIVLTMLAGRLTLLDENVLRKESSSSPQIQKSAAS
jgi:Na+/H+-dicarboxylate symporter